MNRSDFTPYAKEIDLPTQFLPETTTSNGNMANHFYGNPINEPAGPPYYRTADFPSSGGVEELPAQQQFETLPQDDHADPVPNYEPAQNDATSGSVDAEAQASVTQNPDQNIDPRLLEQNLPTPFHPEAVARPASESQSNEPFVGLMHYEDGYILNGVVYKPAQPEGGRSPEPAPVQDRLLFTQQLPSPRAPVVVVTQPSSPLARAVPSPHAGAPPRMDRPDLPAPPQPAPPLAPVAPQIGPTYGHADSLYKLPGHHYNFQAFFQGYHHPVNFTAVEIIVFLPNLYENEMIARRLVNNGMQNTAHAEILKQYRGLDLSHQTVGNGYLTALRPAGWKALWNKCTAKEKSAMWTRKNHGKIPQGWDGTKMAVNDFVPDRLRKPGVSGPEPPSVPFRSLVDGVINMPQGDDAADLTRAIQFACTDGAPEYMFPDHLITILQNVGHANVGANQYDRAIARRYDKVYEANKNKAPTLQHGRTVFAANPAPMPPVNPTQPLHVTPALLQQTPYSTAPMPAAPQAPLSASVADNSFGSTRMKHLNLNTRPVMHENAVALTADNKALQDGAENAEKTAEIDPDVFLLRNFDYTSLPADFPWVRRLQYETAVHFALRPDQEDTGWCTSEDHIDYIMHLLGNPSMEQMEAENQRRQDEALAALLQVPVGDINNAVMSDVMSPEYYEELFGEAPPEPSQNFSGSG